MTWSNIATIDTNENWQYSPIFSEKIVRLRHTSNNNLYSRGLVAQSFNNSNQLELFNVKRIYPFYGDDIIICIPILELNQRLVIKGETKYKPSSFWKIAIDVWQGEFNLNPDINQLNQSLENIENNINQNRNDTENFQQNNLLNINNGFWQ